MLKKIFALSGLKVALLITLIILGTFMWNSLFPTGSFLSLMDKKWVDFIMKGRGTQPHSEDVVIAVVDTLSVDRYGKWPWPRERFAQLVDAMNEYYHVGTIGWDIVFSEVDETPAKVIEVTNDYKRRMEALGLNGSGRAQRLVRYMDETITQLDGDAKFGKTLGKTPNSVIGYFFFAEGETEHLTEAELAESERRVGGSEVQLVINTPGRLPVGNAVESNIDKIYRGGHLSGHFNMTPDFEDGTVRRVHLLIRYRDKIYPSLDLQMLRHHFGSPSLTVIADQETGDVLEIRIGDNMAIQTNTDGSMMINYKGPVRTFPHYSIYDIIERNIPKDALEGKILLVGATEVGIFDLRTTPVGVNFPGVEVHANVLDNLLTNSYFKYHDYLQGITALLILGIGILLGVTLPHLKHIFGTVLAIVIVVGYVFAHYYMVTELLTWTSLVYIVLVTVTVWGGVTLFRFLVSDRDQRFIKGAFRHYLSAEVVEQLADNPDMLKLGGERRVMTAFFSDVQSFSSLSEKLTPEQLVRLLNVYLTNMSNIIMRYGGTVDKYEGDAIIAFFGAPVSYDDHATRSVLVTLECHRRLAELNAEWYESGLYKSWVEAVGPKLKHRIGLNTGEMVVGNMGSENRFDYTMMGNSVNLAARLEGANKNYGTFTCVSEYTYEPAKEAVVGREMDLIRVIGIKQPVRIYEVLARKGELNDQQMKGIAIFEKGLQLYRQQHWDESIKHFTAVQKVFPDDPPSLTFIRRCQEYKAAAQNPATALPADWDGVFEASAK